MLKITVSEIFSVKAQNGLPKTTKLFQKVDVLGMNQDMWLILDFTPNATLFLKFFLALFNFVLKNMRNMMTKVWPNCYE